MRIFSVISFYFIFFNSALAQVYHFPETTKSFFKATNFGTVHGYLEVVNDTGDSVLMRWISRRDSLCPSEWVFNFDDQNSNYTPVLHLDSANFYLKPPSTFLQKMIIGLNHQGVADTSSINFTVFPVDNRADSTRIQYRFFIAQGPPPDTNDTASGVENLWMIAQIDFRWSSNFELTPLSTFDEINCYDLNGKLVAAWHKPLIHQLLQVQTNASFLFIESKKQGKINITKIGRSER